MFVHQSFLQLQLYLIVLKLALNLAQALTVSLALISFLYLAMDVKLCSANFIVVKKLISHSQIVKLVLLAKLVITEILPKK